MFDQITIIVAAAIIVAIMGVVAKHVINNKIHPEKEDIVFKDVCETRHKGLEDCVENKINALDKKVDTFRQDVKDDFVNFRQDVKDDFVEVKELIRNNK